MCLSGNRAHFASAVTVTASPCILWHLMLYRADGHTGVDLHQEYGLSELQVLADALYSLNGLFPVAEGGETEIALAAGAKASAGGTNDVHVLQ